MSFGVMGGPMQPQGHAQMPFVFLSIGRIRKRQAMHRAGALLKVGLIPLKAVSSNYTMDENLGAGTYYYVIVADNIYGNSTISNWQSKSIAAEGGGIPGFELLPTLMTLLLLIGSLPMFKLSKPPKIYT
jgi:hypothetical protein